MYSAIGRSPSLRIGRDKKPGYRAARAPCCLDPGSPAGASSVTSAHDRHARRDQGERQHGADQGGPVGAAGNGGGGGWPGLPPGRRPPAARHARRLAAKASSPPTPVAAKRKSGGEMRVPMLIHWLATLAGSPLPMNWDGHPAAIPITVSIAATANQVA